MAKKQTSKKATFVKKAKATAPKATVRARDDKKNEVNHSNVVVRTANNTNPMTQLEMTQTSAILFNSLFKLGSVPLARSAELADMAQMQQLTQCRTAWNFDHLAPVIQTLLQRNPKHCIYLVLEEEACSFASNAIEFPVVSALIVPQGATPPPVLQLKSVEGNDPFVPFDEIGIAWIPLNKLLVSNSIGGKTLSPLLAKFNQVIGHDRVLALNFKGRNLRGVDDTIKGKYMRASLLDCRPAIFPRYQTLKSGKKQIEVNSAPFTVLIGENKIRIDDVYSKGYTGTTAFITEFIADHEEEGASESHRDAILKAIEDGFACKRQEIEQLASDNFKNYGGDFLQGIRSAKVYPSNLQQVVPTAVKQMQAARNLARLRDQGANGDGVPNASILQINPEALLSVEQMQAVNAPFDFAYTPVTAHYGPARMDEIFYGQPGENDADSTVH